MVHLACCVLDTALGQKAYASTVKTIAETKVMLGHPLVLADWIPGTKDEPRGLPWARDHH